MSGIKASLLSFKPLYNSTASPVGWRVWRRRCDETLSSYVDTKNKNNAAVRLLSAALSRAAHDRRGTRDQAEDTHLHWTINASSALQ